MKAIDHLRHHVRFYIAASVGLVAWALAYAVDGPFRLLLASDAFFLTHILAIAPLAAHDADARFRERASQGDDGLLLISLIAIGSLALCLGAVFSLLNHPVKPTSFRVVLSLASVPLGWTMLQAVFAFHYAHAYYSGDGKRPAGGLEFPGKSEPKAWDFLYHGFTVGMTAQVSDVTVLTTRMRRLTLAHSLVSYAFNTFVLAVAVNVVVLLASK